MTAPLVLLHGFTGSPASWDAALEIAPPGARVFAPPLPGHDPGSVCDATFEKNIDGLEKKITGANLRGCHLIGYSLGARAALGLLVKHPQLAARATLIGAHFGLTDDDARRERRDRDRIWVRLLRERGLAAFVDAWEALPLFATQSGCPPERLAAQRSARMSHQAASLARSLETMGLAEMPSYWDGLDAITVDVELVTGALDARFSELAVRALSYNHRLRHRTVAGVGHNVVFEAPASIW